MSARPDGNGRLAGRIALVTGASRGIGRAVSVALSREGAHVVAVARTRAGLEELDDEISSATLVPMDVTDYGAIDRLGAALFERHGRLDILIGNAGILGNLSPVGHIDIRVWEQVLAVNLTANWRLLRSMDPLLRQSDAGRVIMVSSSVAATPRAYWGAYAVSKAGLDNLTLMYAAEVAKTPIRVNALDPRGTRTRMRAQAYPGEDPDTLKAPDDVAGLFVDLSLPTSTRHGEIVTHKGLT